LRALSQLLLVKEDYHDVDHGSKVLK